MKLIIGIILIYSFSWVWLSRPSSDYLCQVSFLNVGQGDSILVEAAGKKLLIDGGADNTVNYRLGTALPYWQPQLDYLLLTHPHGDHVTGLVAAAEIFKPKIIFMTGVKHYNAAYQALLSQPINMEIIQTGDTIKFSEQIWLEILYPDYVVTGESVKDINATSIVSRLHCGGQRFLFTGDSGVEEEHTMIEANFDLQAEILKVGHHGSSTSTSEEFLQAVQPELAIIQVGEDNPFNHPSLLVIRRLERDGVEVWRNDINGTIVITVQADNSREFKYLAETW